MSDELATFNTFENRLREHSAVQSLSRAGGEETIEAGHKNESTSHYDVHVTPATKQKIAEEQADGVEGDPFSETLDELLNFVELTLNGSPGEYTNGVLHVSFTYHRG